jgi:hypothetical protein
MNSRTIEVVLWVAAVVLMLAAAGYQRRTGPTYPVHGSFEVAGQTYNYELVRSAYTTDDAQVEIPDPVEGVTAVLHYKRFRQSDEFASVPFRADEGRLIAELPAQPPAGKLEYFVILQLPNGGTRIPDAARGNVVMRFKDHVPLYFLLPHVLMMFFSMLIGLRAGLAALFAPRPMRTLTWITLIGMTIGGMVLGPIAQKYAFGAFWTGFPFGYDLTDNKVLIMWLLWVAAGVIVWYRIREDVRLPRYAVLVAALATVVVYVIPHSVQGSELDYEALERGVPAEEAIRTGRQPEDGQP